MKFHHFWPPLEYFCEWSTWKKSFPRRW